MSSTSTSGAGTSPPDSSAAAAGPGQDEPRPRGEHFRYVFEQTSAGLAETDLSGRFVRVNDRYCDLVGRTREALLTLRMQDITHPEDLPANLRLFEQLAAGHSNGFSIEKRYVRPDGTDVWVENHVAPIRDDAGVVRSLVAAVTDTTDRRRAEATLRESEERYRTLFTSINEGFALKEAVRDEAGDVVDFRFVEVNPAFELHSGLRDVVGRTMRETMPDLEPVWIERFRNVLETGKPLRFQDRAESLGKWFQVFAARLGDPTLERVVVIVSDVTEHRRAEQALREREERLRLIVESLTEYAIITLDTSGRVSSWNSGATQLLGYEAAEIVGRSGSVIFTPEDRGAGAPDTELREALEQGRAANERWHVRKDGTRFWGSGVVKPLRTPDGDMTGLVKIMRDMTAQRVHEEQMALADRRKDEFLATLAHELRNPLAPLSFALETMQQADADPALTAQARETMQRQVAHMVRLIDDLLDIGRITRDKLELRTELVTIDTIVANAIEATRPVCEGAGHDMRVELPETPVRLHADVARLTQVFGNLIGNACKFTPPGGHISIRAEHADGEVHVTVRDDGIGIAPEILPRIFDMFVQAEPTLERRSQGLGIGLTLVRRLVEMHGGAIEARSEGVGRGAQFIVRLPAVVEEPVSAMSRQDAASASASASPPGGGGAARRPTPLSTDLTFLVAEDNRDSASMLASLLRTAGHTVWVAHDGRQTLDVAARHRPDVILLDIGLPDLNGFDVCRTLRAGTSGPRPVVVALTGWGQTEHRQLSAEAGFDAHLVKPVPLTALLDTLGRLLDGGDPS